MGKVEVGILVRFTHYAEARVQRRKLSREVVIEVAENPQQVIDEEERRVAQSRYLDPSSGREYLLRVVYEERAEEKLVITVYKTSKIRRYWRTP